MQFKTFLLGKDGEENGRQDALAYNPERGLFAVADGVSNSFHPEMAARILCEKFAAIEPEEMNDWADMPARVLLPQLVELWQTQVAEYMSSLSGRLLRHEQYNFDTWKVGASTFCGLHLNEADASMRYAIVGDSTLFVCMADGTVMELNSSQKHVDESGTELTEFSNTTDAILSNGAVAGQWLMGEMPLSGVRTIALMTDGMAKWFQKEMTEAQLPDMMLWELQTRDDFKNLAETAREDGDMDDDLAVILIHPDII